MGGNQSKPDPSIDRQKTLTTTAPAITPTPCPSNNGNIRELLLVIAFFAGILLALLLMALVFTIRRYRKSGQSSSHALDPYSDPLAKTPAITDEALPSASMPIKTSEEKRGQLTANHSANSDSIVYAEIKVTNSPISNQA
ncbi:transmembrane protein C1orf162 homolog [Rousettus aegyptiacus]|uniref:Uncharacterized protein n=1 Tax=Rousettus aegyptiacus TaxID=9407 RepID=A0A7J8BBP7_ROUAE|nr:transmembrane protein C1orf162 homolog [Rousettus aegyptiacus]XP_015979900.2 transmembrane protein C1orf162 homolog [Rousettus aegyptiacus]XP_015979902.2 transmembrane protein C1orf162 homolog [Rousettus aegyptiacus]XP_015979903.2 transmembrane protein C1orf162 homolog [Rousettus aegyptiacus]XP_015979904.2 transmembrane protein C1orf162 homolog [Rousettus aegyptiacus]XP_015979905.2 transmembrane protein C1orf162 homolog [Rousettus aegyptiacus]XP_036090976.1 transmembrane protein C1orf162 h